MATDTHSEYVIRIFFLGQHLLGEHVSILLSYVHCLSCWILTLQLEDHKSSKISTNQRVERMKFHIEETQILEAAVQNLFAKATCRPGFGHPCLEI